MYVVKRPDEIIQELLLTKVMVATEGWRKLHNDKLRFYSSPNIIRVMKSTDRKNHLEESRCEWEHYIEIDLRRNRLGVDFIYQAQNRDKWQARVSTLLELEFHTVWVIF
jgi:hypothetical protein